MTEAEWLACADPRVMLTFMEGRASNRGFWLFGATAARQVWDRLNIGWRMNVGLVERYADGIATAEEAYQVESAIPLNEHSAYGGIYLTANPIEFARHCAGICQLHASWTALENDDSVGYRRNVALHARAQTELVRDIFGNPFRPVVADPAWLTDTAVSLARGMYESHDFSAMPILADALQDAGCDNTDMLNHCREASATHVRGCWVVDLVLGKS